MQDHLLTLQCESIELPRKKHLSWKEILLFLSGSIKRHCQKGSKGWCLKIISGRSSTLKFSQGAQESLSTTHKFNKNKRNQNSLSLQAPNSLPQSQLWRNDESQGGNSDEWDEKTWEEWRISWTGVLGGSWWQKVPEADNLGKKFLKSALASFQGVASGKSFPAFSPPLLTAAAAVYTACTSVRKIIPGQHLYPSGVRN